jgi:hypothetical protein
MFFLAVLWIDARVVVSSTGVLCCEFWSDERNRYVHVDLFGGLVDQPLSHADRGLVEHRLVALGVNHVADVSKRYVADIDEAFERRRREYTEDDFAALLKHHNAVYQLGLDEEAKRVIADRLEADGRALEEEDGPVGPSQEPTFWD